MARPARHQANAAFWNHMANASLRFGRAPRVCDVAHPANETPFVRLAEDIVKSRVIRRKPGATATHEGPLSQHAVRVYLLALAVTLGDCSASEVVQNWTPTPAAAPAPGPDMSQPNYRRVVADNNKAIFPNSASLRDLEISEVRLVDHVKGPAWVTCLKFRVHVDPVVGQSAPNSTTTEDPVVAPSAPSSTTSGSPQYYAIFIQGDKIIDSRLGVAIDQCRSQTFQPFDLSPPATAKKG